MKFLYISLFILQILTAEQSFSQRSYDIFINNDIQLIHLEDSVYIHVSWHSLEPYGRFPSNGLILIKNGKALMIDTPMDNEKTEKLVTFVKDSLHAEITTIIPGHYHDDCISGLEYLHKIGVKSIANIRTINKCKELNLPIPQTAFRDSLFLSFEGEFINLRYFGGGHSTDNITMYFPEKEILFGGCLIKSSNSESLGNTTDAVIEDWYTSVSKIIEAYPDVKIVIPGHGKFGSKELLTHTIELVKIYKDNE